MSLHAEQGDITRRDDDAIVNAANEMLLPGGGVCGAIHRAAGPDLEKACRAIGSCPTGSAVITPGFGLKARHVIHAVGPVWHGGGQGEPALLKSAYDSIFRLVAERRLASVAIPAISTGIFGYPLDEAAEIAIAAARYFDKTAANVKVTFMCFDGKTYAVYNRRLGADTKS